MKRNSLFMLCCILITGLIISCSSEEDPTNDNPDVTSIQIDSTLKSFYTIPGTGFESIFSQAIPNANGFNINLYWYPSTPHGIYLDFNNSVGDALIDATGFLKAFDSGIRIDTTLAGTWSGTTDGAFSYDYVVNPTANKGNLAGQGDKYIVFRAFSDLIPQLKYYGWLRVNVSANGRDVKVISIGYQKNANTSLRTGEL